MKNSTIENTIPWENYQIGKYVKGTVSSIHDYDIIIQFKYHQVKGFCLPYHAKEVKVSYQVECRILDVDKKEINTGCYNESVSY